MKSLKKKRERLKQKRENNKRGITDIILLSNIQTEGIKPCESVVIIKWNSP